MIEAFAGIAILCATSKVAGLQNSIAVDKVRKRNCRCSIFQLDLTNFKTVPSWNNGWTRHSFYGFTLPQFAEQQVGRGRSEDFPVILSLCEVTVFQKVTRSF